jgi:multidrug efflux pump subunit AcrA (membrane-fusion protein)
MSRRFIANSLVLALILMVFFGTLWAVQRFHRPGQLDVLTAQAMDMSAMRPPTGAAPVSLASVRRGSLSDTLTYTGTVRAYNEQDISARIVGTVISLPVYPGDPVRAGQVVAQLDTAEVSAKAGQADAQARQAQQSLRVAELTHGLRSQAALDQAAASEGASEQAVVTAQSEARAAQDAVADAQAGVQSALANTDYWKMEIAREKQLADAGAASQQEYQSELSQAQAAEAALTQAKSKVRQAQATVGAAQAKVVQAHREVAAAQAGTRMASADLVVAAGQADQEAAGAVAAQAAAREATVVLGYTRIISPANGVVTARPIAPGTLVQPGMTLLKIAEIDRVRVQAHVAVADLAGIGPGTPVEVISQGDTTNPIAAKVTSVFPDANDQTRTAVVEAVIPNPNHRLLPGAFVTVQIAKPSVFDKTLVPAGAITTEGGSSYLWLASGGAASAAPMTYQCEKCHMIYSAADAKKNDYHDPMDGGRLLPVMPTVFPATGGLTAHRVSVQTGASDGAWTEILSGEIPAADKVVTHGQAGLTEGAALAATAWGADGPRALPTVAAASRGKTLYRCEKCGMTYSESDAKQNHFIDPMDGGRLVPVKGQ